MTKLTEGPGIIAWQTNINNKVCALEYNLDKDDWAIDKTDNPDTSHNHFSSYHKDGNVR